MRLLIVLAAALVLAGPVGGASRPPELFVNALDTTPGTLAETDVDLSLPATVTRVTEYVPSGYVLALDRPAGTVIGSATIVTARSRLTATLLAATPAENPCAPGEHAAVWTSGSLTLLVDPTSGGETSLGAYKLVFCPEPGT